MYQNGGQTNIQIPYEVAGSAMASVVLTQGTQTTAAFALPVAATVPGIFTIDFSGTGQAVASRGSVPCHCTLRSHGS